MGVMQEATRLHVSGYNCAQSVLAACRDYTGLEDGTALAVSAGFGGGLRCGEICGAVSGAMMAIGMACPYNDCTDLEAKSKIAALARECTGRFEEAFGCLRCQDLKANKVSCPVLIEYAAQLAEDMIKKEKENGNL